MNVYKPDSKEIIDFLNKLEKRQKIKKTDRSFWPSFIFHYTPLETAVKILKDETLKSRYDLERNNELLISIASRDILERTEPTKKKYVRLYFRPRTPTQYHTEGIRPHSGLSPFKVHCPIPIFFLFESRKLLTLKNTYFTDGNFSKKYAKIGNTFKFLAELPFDKIYHVGPYNQYLDSDIKFHRCAEVLYPHSLNLESLKYICCRSEAEKDTFLSLLPFDIWLEWNDKIIVSRTRLFESKWTYLEKVILLKEKAVFYFSPDSITPGPFRAKLEIIDGNSEKVFIRERDSFYTNSANYFETKFPYKMEGYTIKFYLDSHLCYQNSFQSLENKIVF